MTTSRLSDPRGNSAGQIRLPTFSIKSKLIFFRLSRCRAFLTKLASRWHSLPVFMATVSTPCLAISSASMVVVKSPLKTAIQ